MDKSTLIDAYYLFVDEYEGEQPYLAAEMTVGYLLELGFNSSDAHSALCTVQTLYDAGATIK